MTPSTNDLSRLAGFLMLVLSALSMSACGGGGSSTTSGAQGAGGTTAPAVNAAAATPSRVSIGDAFFNDTSLSSSGQQSCSSCHADVTAHADPAGTTLPLGGSGLDQQGSRSSPTLLYLDANTPFQFVNNQPRGGFTWDGRADSRAIQAKGPLLDMSEMANASISEVAQKVRRVSYFGDFARLYNLPGSASDQQVFDALTSALETYQAQSPDFLLFNSKFDQFLDGTATLTAQEARGLAAFNDPARGNCASCHTSRVGNNGSRPLFTNFRYAALGLPRNPAISANADPSFFDMGLCGPKRTDLFDRLDLCGQFKIPTLRNIALTAPYFHNGMASTLEEAISFYATRDINPGRWYPLVGGQPDKFNDLPPALRSNVTRRAPLDLAPGSTPRLQPQDVNDIAAFLRTLTDDLHAAPGSATVSR